MAESRNDSKALSLIYWKTGSAIFFFGPWEYGVGDQFLHNVKKIEKLKRKSSIYLQIDRLTSFNYNYRLYHKEINKQKQPIKNKGQSLIIILTFCNGYKIPF